LLHAKVWPLENFVKLEASARKNDPRIRFVLTGSENEKPLGKIFQRQSNSIVNLIGKTSVLDLAALMSYISIYITSDTGALHVASATDVDLIALFGPTRTERTGPYPCRPNHTVIRRRSIEEIRVEDVLEILIR
jgi:heptosyltransferase-1/heptosyltransferase-2